jgi:hypothetical protein
MARIFVHGVASFFVQIVRNRLIDAPEKNLNPSEKKSMADTMTPNLDLLYMVVGSPNREVVVNDGLQVLDTITSGVLTIDVSGSGDYTLTDGVTGQAKQGSLLLTGVLTGNRSLLVPDKSRQYLVHNGTTGAFTLTVKTVSGGGVTIGADTWAFLISDGTNVMATVTGGGGGTLPSASETQAGIVELATSAEVTAGTDDTRAITPLKLAGRLTAVLPGAASETVAGLVELATPTEVQTGTDTTRAVTAAGLSSRSATEIRTGLLEVATTAEVTTGTDDLRAVTPLKLAQRLAALPAASYATETASGVVELATAAEVQGGADTIRVITPAGLITRTALESRTGLVQLASTTEANAGTDTTKAVTPAGLQTKITAIPNATTSGRGLIVLASDAEVQAGTDSAKAVTPAGLNSRTATDARYGLIELATSAEVTAGTDEVRAVTPLTLAQRLAALPAASETVAGLVELATSAEVTAGTDATRAVTPAGLAAKLPAGTALSVTRYASSGTALEATPGLTTTSDGRLGVGATPESGRVLQVQGTVRVRAGLIEIVRDDGQQGALNLLQYGTGLARLQTFVAGGTEAAPTASPANRLLFEFLGAGHDGSSFPAGYRAAVQFLTSEPWTPTAQGTALRFLTTLTGGTSGTQRLGIDGQGNLCTWGAVAGAGLQAGLVLKSGTAPTGSHPGDAVQAWVADRAATAGKASLHVRTEDGTSHVLGDCSGLGTLCDATLGSGASYQALNVKGSVLTLGQSSVQERALALAQSAFVVSTDASRTSRWTLSVYDATAAREGLRIETNGTAPLIGFLGASAVGRQTVPAAATDATTTQALANALRTALVTLGLCV